MRPLVAILLAVLVAPGCGKRERAAPARGGPDDPMAEKLRHCPTTVDGAQVEVDELAGGVAFRIAATDTAAIAEIRRRAAHLVELTAGRAARGEHGGGEGGGTMRNCPVVTTDTALAVEDTPGGARITVTPTGASSVEALRAETRRRREALRAP